MEEDKEDKEDAKEDNEEDKEDVEEEKIEEGEPKKKEQFEVDFYKLNKYIPMHLQKEVWQDNQNFMFA